MTKRRRISGILKQNLNSPPRVRDCSVQTAPTMANDDSPEPKLSECCVSHLFQKTALKSPDKVAVIHASGGAKIISQQFDNNHVAGEPLKSGVSMPPQPPVYEGDRCFTYSEILSAVNSLSTRLRRALDGGSRVVISENKYTPRIIGIYMEPSVEYIVAVLTVLRCGEAFMPLDPSWPQERILYVVSSSRAELIIGCGSSGEDSYFHRLDNLHWFVNSGRCPVLSMSMSDCVKEQSKVRDLQWHCESEVSRLFCYLMYTSGSTGKPKGVCGTEAGILNRFLWMQDLYPLHGEGCLLFKTSTSFIDHMQEFLSGLLTGSTVVVPPFSELRENILSLIDFLQMYAVNRLVAVPSLMSAVLLPLQSPKFMRLRNHLKVLVLSGEVLHLNLCKSLLKLLPHTDVLNLYGSTEVSGDCTYFDCNQLPSIFENETVVTVPIGSPLHNCDVVLIGKNASGYGEICVRGLCNAAGYFDYPSVTPFDYAELPDSSTTICTYSEKKPQLYYKTGDFARQLESGVFIFIGREDRTVKFNGQRITLEEIESTLLEHPDIINAAVVCQKSSGEISHIEAHLVMKQKEDCNGHLRSSIRSWITNKLPQAVVPSRIILAESLPISSSGKVDYNKLLANASPKAHSGHATVEFQDNDPLKVISKVFCDALMVKEVSTGDNFFDMGGNSLSAAYVAYSLGISMKLLYTFPTPLKLQMALQRKIESSDGIPRSLAEVELDSATIDENILPSHSMEAKHDGSKPVEYSSTDHQVKRLKQDTSLSYTRKYGSPVDKNFWDGMPLQIDCSFSRCNRSKHSKADNSLSFPLLSEHVLRGRKGCMQQLWKVHMDSCVDASPLIVCKGKKMFLFIGSHSGKFICADAKSGFIVWEIKLEGRTECSAAVVDDFSQVVVGCYQGNIYFLRWLDGNICWMFHTGGEVKSQPLVDEQRHLVWCGSYDQNLYGLDYIGYSCIYKLSCGGSIFSAPTLDEERDKLFVASTSGLVTAVSLKASSFFKLWMRDFQAPIFGSLAINCSNGNVICCLVNGDVAVVDTDGSIFWKASCGGPIFAGACISKALPSQVIVCCRDGYIYSFELEKGNLLWKHNVGSPITSSAYVSEHLELTSDMAHPPDRLVCVCTSSGNIHVLRINLGTMQTRQQKAIVVEEFGRLDLEGDIFSSPLMVCGRIFVGCRNDYLYSFGIDLVSSV